MIQDNVYIGGAVTADYRAKQAATNRTLHDRLSELTSRLFSLGRNLSDITSSICGQAPETALNAVPAGIDTAHNKLDAAFRLVSSMEDEIKRLENSVGQDTPLKPQQQKASMLNGGQSQLNQNW